MKKNILTLVVLIATVAGFASNPNENTKSYSLKGAGSGAKCFDESSHIINVGVGLGGGSYYRFNNSFGRTVATPLFSVSYEQPWSKKIGPGYLGVGGYFGFRSVNYRYDYSNLWGKGYYYEHSWKYYMITGRAAYHWDVLNTEKAEVYGGLLLGLRMYSYSYDDNDPNFDYRQKSGSLSPVLDLFVGARYYFTQNVAAYAELGGGVSYANVGLSFKF